MDSLRLYSKYLGVSVRGQLRYRLSFLMQSVGQFLINGSSFLGLWALFRRFGNLRGWTLPEAAVLYGLVNTSFSLADTCSAGFDRFADTLKAGDFDRLLLRPRSAAFQLAAQELSMRRLGRLAQGAAILAWGAVGSGAGLGASRLFLLAGATLGGACLFYGLLVLQATLAFWTLEPLEVVNTLTYGGMETGKYPLSAYRPAFRRFFTFVVPLACVTYFPALTALGKTYPPGYPGWLGWVSPLAGPAFLALSLRAWKLGARKYASTGS